MKFAVAGIKAFLVVIANKQIKNREIHTINHFTAFIIASDSSLEVINRGYNKLKVSDVV